MSGGGCGMSGTFLWMIAEASNSSTAVDAVLVLAAALALCRDGGDARGTAFEGLAVCEELAVDCGRGADAQGVALAAV
jgi:hypothetical protein